MSLFIYLKDDVKVCARTKPTPPARATHPRRLQALVTSCRLSRDAALQLLLRTPRLMALEPAAISQRAAGLEAALSPPPSAAEAAAAAAATATPPPVPAQSPAVRSIALVRPTEAVAPRGGVHMVATCPGLLLASTEQVRQGKRLVVT